MMINTNLKNILKTCLVIGAATCALAIYDTEQQTQALSYIRFRYKWLVVMIILTAMMLTEIYTLLRPGWLDPLWDRLQTFPLDSLLW
ncbi:MAG TPA: hypothetical protein VHM28_04130, partial [Anaerolineales bacterium]|nr:hypothetical protein [Anaerolineales bacterium]